MYLLTMGMAHAETVDQKLKTLPDAVQKTIATDSPQGSVVSIEPKTMDGAMRYKVGVQDHDKHLTLVIEASGNLLVKKTEVATNALPAPVRKTLDTQSQGGKVEMNSLVSKSSKTYYEVELKVSGHKKEVVIEPSGELTKVEEIVPLNTVPAAVKTVIDKNASQGKFLKVKTIIVHGKLVAYEAAIDVNGLKTEFKLTPNGQPLK
jgi:uncharacterized membrane protein YkoI